MGMLVLVGVVVVLVGALVRVWKRGAFVLGCGGFVMRLRHLFGGVAVGSTTHRRYRNRFAQARGQDHE